MAGKTSPKILRKKVVNVGFMGQTKFKTKLFIHIYIHTHTHTEKRLIGCALEKLKMNHLCMQHYK